MGEPCRKCEGYPDAIGSFVASNRAAVRAEGERDEARATIERVKALHFLDVHDAGWCAECDIAWPCPTIKTLEAS